jgi:hypothetical protein
LLCPEPSLQVSRDALSHDAFNQRLQGGPLWTELLPAYFSLVGFFYRSLPETAKKCGENATPTKHGFECLPRKGRDLLQAKALSGELSVRRSERGCRRHSAPQQPVFQQLGDWPRYGRHRPQPCVLRGRPIRSTARRSAPSRHRFRFCGRRLEGFPLLTSLLGVLEANVEGCRTAPTSH